MNILFKSLTEAVEKTLKEFATNISVKAEETEDNKFKVVASVESADRVGETILASAWDIKNYMKNPIILSNHWYKIENIVGKATNVTVKDKSLIIEWLFASSPQWQLAKQLYNEWVLKTVSVWFMIRGRDENDNSIITKAELLELSFVPVPCHPDALSLDKKTLEKALSRWLIIEEKQDWDKIDKVLESIGELTKEIQEIKAVISSKNTDPSTDDNGKDTKGVEIPKDVAQDFIKSLNEGLRLSKKA